MVSGDGPTNYRHPTEESAETEAKRLAAQHPGTTFFVLRAVAKYRKVDVERTILDYPDNIPF